MREVVRAVGACLIALTAVNLSGCPKTQQFLVANQTGRSIEVIGDETTLMIPDGESKEIRTGDGLIHTVRQRAELRPALRVSASGREWIYLMTDDFYRAQPGKQIAMRLDRDDCAAIFHIDEKASAITSHDAQVGRDCD